MEKAYREISFFKIQSSHTCSKLRLKYKGIIGPEIYSSKGSQISATLFVIYMDRLTGKYEEKLHGQCIQNRPLITIRMGYAEYTWRLQRELARFQVKGDRETKTPYARKTGPRENQTPHMPLQTILP